MSEELFSEIFDKRFMSGMKYLDVNHYEEVLLYPPSSYMDLTKPIGNLKEALRLGKEDKKSFMQLKTRGAPELFDEAGGKINIAFANKVGGTHRVKLRFTDGQTHGMVMIFGRAGGGNLDSWCKLASNENFHAYGLFNDDWNGVVSINYPEHIKKSEVNRIVPRYSGKEKIITPFRIASKIQNGLLEFTDQSSQYICDILSMDEEQGIKASKINFKTFKEFILMMHRPKTTEDIVRVTDAINKLNSLVVYQKIQEHKVLSNVPESNFNIDVKGILPGLVSKLPFKLTNDQRMAIWDTLKDLNDDQPMRRLLSGDVGTGKTVCYMLPAVAAQKSGKNVIIMSPNSLLSDQIANEIRATFPEVPVVEIQGGMKAYPDVPDNAIVVGTTAILFWLESINYEHKIDLYILDEQQKLGREQKERLIQKHTNFIEATATAIPRTIALIKYSDMKVSRIQECPVKKTIHSYIIGNERRSEAFHGIKETLAEGGQVAILYPRRTREFSRYHYQLTLSEEGKSAELLAEIYNLDEEKLEIEFDPKTNKLEFETSGPANKRIKSIMTGLEGVSYKLLEELPPSNDEQECKKSVEEAYKKWLEMFPGRVAMLHGQTNKKDKFRIIDEIKTKKIDILITSSVIEIGLTIPSLKFIMVVGADRMGASTLHQIRGRLVRNGGEGSFYMFVDRPIGLLSEKSLERLQTVRDNLNGFDIAEKDMMQRGAGDIGKLGNKQSGLTKGLCPGSKTTPEEIDAFLKEIEHESPSI